MQSAAQSALLRRAHERHYESGTRGGYDTFAFLDWLFDTELRAVRGVGAGRLRFGCGGAGGAGDGGGGGGGGRRIWDRVECLGEGDGSV